MTFKNGYASKLEDETPELLTAATPTTDTVDSNADGQDISTIPAFSLRGSLSPLVVGPALFVAAIALFAPERVLDEWPIARSFTSWLVAKFPFMAGHAASTSYAQVALLVNCLTVALVCVVATVWFWQSIVNYPRLLARNIALKPLTVPQQLMTIFVGIPVCLICVYVMVALPGDPSWGHGLTSRHRGGLAVMSALIVYLMSMALGAWPLMIRIFVDMHFRKNR
jgi:hypothetical protein